MTSEMIEQRIEYIHNNPLASGFVDNPVSWQWSSCASYEQGVKGKIELVHI